MTEPLIYIRIPGLEHYPHVMSTWAIMILFAALTLAVRASMKVVPTGWQNFVESLVLAVYDQCESVIGHGGARFLPLVGTLALFVFTGNVLGLVPGFESPTANLNTNLALSLTVFLTYNFVGIRKHGVLGYFKHFLGPVWWLSWLIFPIEIISHLARPVTLALRLFGNIKGEDLVIFVLLFLVPLLLPTLMMAFAVVTCALQTIVFSLLTMVYLQGAVADEH
ncbi:MAG: F0F1 ATP synthase subunit A [Nitrospinae bacterium]|nr:F0F1 ATP synthase subunit A [Nitrospinota bacterium]